MTIKDRQARQRDDTRTKIMDAARRLFAGDGYEAVSVRQIAQAIEYSPTAIYVHFQDKRDLFAAICAEDYQALAASVQGIAGVADPVERIVKLGIAYCKFGLAHPNHYRLMFMTPVRFDKSDEERRPQKGNPSADSWAMCRLVVRQAAEAGRLRPEFADVELAAQTFWAGVHGVVSIEIAMGKDPWIDWTPVEKRVKAMVAALSAGICTEPGKKRKRGSR